MCGMIAGLENCETRYFNILTKLKGSCFPDSWMSHLWPPHLRMLGRNLQLNNIALLDFLLWIVMSIIDLLITGRNVTFYLISIMVSGLLDQLWIFWQIHLIKLLGLLLGLAISGWVFVFISTFSVIIGLTGSRWKVLVGIFS